MNGNLAELHSPIINSSDTSKGYSNFLNKLIITLEGITPIKVVRVKNKENEWFDRGSCRKIFEGDLKLEIKENLY